MTELFTNPGFETALSGWIATDSGNRAFALKTSDAISGTTSAQPKISAPGYSILYQTITVPSGTSKLDVSFQLTSSFSPRGSVDTREKVRVDILSSADHVTDETQDVLANVFTMTPQDPNITVAKTVFFDLSPYAGQTVTFRIWVADYQGPANFAFDNITTSLTDPANNTAPTFAGLPAAHWDIVTGQEISFPAITVADAENNQLILTITPTGGDILGLTDADLAAAGIQLAGTAADINTALANAKFKAAQDGNGSIEFSLSDGTATAVTEIVNTRASTPVVPAPETPSNPAPVIDVEKAFNGVLGGTLSKDEAAKVMGEIQRGDYSFDYYISGLIKQAQTTSVPALLISDKLGGAAPTQEHMLRLTLFADTQFKAYQAAGSSNPTLGVYEALGRGFSELSDFQAKFGALSAASFLDSAYELVFSRASTPVQHDHFQAQLSYFEALYAGSGEDAAQASIHAKGAVIGQMMGHAVLDEAPFQFYDDQARSFLRDAAFGTAKFNEPLALI